ncbi:hypothetical protein [Rhodoblastus sp.]|uniref:hypothetical protein n=1 Tax=Rhodoblastus sp. TaxID=1962975 RepID=UPI003F9B7AFF
MAGDIWEQAVETFLAMDRGMFVNPQYLIGTPNVWEANPDFMALAFPEKTAWMVEVTKRPRASLFDKIRDFEKDYAPRIRHQLQSMDVIRESVSEEWKIGLWIFAPKMDLEILKSKAQTCGVQTYRSTSLEETLDPSAWDTRFR